MNGIGYSPDKMLQGRLLSYPDAHRYRLGVNYEQIPVNKCPYMVENYQRDGFMQVGENGGANPNYRQNSFDDIIADENYKEPAMQLVTKDSFGESNVADWFDRNEKDNDHYSQPGALYRNVMNDQDRKNLVNNIVGSMSGITGEKKEQIINRALCHFFRMDIHLGMALAKELGIMIDEKMFDGHNSKASAPKAETESDLSSKILNLTMRIRNQYPELIKYLDEMQETIPDEKTPEMSSANLKSYYDSLNSMLDRYILEHPNSVK